METQNPFVNAGSKTKKAKILLYGSYGTGKTILSLQFPSPVMIDMERGSECYSSLYDFSVFHTTDPDGVEHGVEWLHRNKTDRQTIILDSMTEFWSALQFKWSEIFLKRNNGKGNKVEFYDLQPRDWVQIKNQFKNFLRKLLLLDMNVICTCRLKDMYSESEMLKKIGDTVDADRSLPYLFDTVVRLEKTSEGKYIAKTEKDRTNLLPAVFTADYIVFAVSFDLAGWDKLVVPDQYLPVCFREKEITGELLATNKAGAWTSKDGKAFPSSRQLLHIWQGEKANDVTRLLAKRLLAKYPSVPDEIVPAMA